MSEEIKTEAELLAAFADNSSGLITERDIRNFVVSAYDEISKAGMEPAYGGLYASGETIYLPGADGETLIEEFTTTMTSANVVSSVAESTLTIGVSGVYEVISHIRFNPTTQSWGLVIRNGAALVAENTPIPSSKEASIHHIVDLTDGDVLRLYIKDGGSSSGGITLSRVSLSVKRIA